MPTIWTRLTQGRANDLHKVAWPTRSPRPAIYDDGLPSTAAMIRALPKVTR